VLNGRAYNGDTLIASSSKAKVMYETRLAPVVYFPKTDLLVDIVETSDLNTFCPFKGTASYKNIKINDEPFENALWYYQNALPEAEAVEDYLAFNPAITTRFDLAGNVFKQSEKTNISGPMVDWILREAWRCSTPQELTKSIAEKLIGDGVAISRISVMIWSLHPMIAGKFYIWTRSTGELQELTPSYDIHNDDQYINSPLRHVTNGLGGVRQKLTGQSMEFSFPIMDDLKAGGATDYVAMPLPFSTGQTNVLTLTSDHPDGQSLLETYLGKRTGARVLGGEIRRGDGDEIDAAILFCDLRDSTALEEKLGRAAYLKLLNTFFEQTTDMINNNDGEVLKFIGDAVLAIFPANQGNKTACQQAYQTAQEILRHLDDPENKSSHPDINCAIGIAFGEVTYGNVGSRERLDFTVIGQAANVAARLADLGKKHGHRVTMTKDIVARETDCTKLGSYELRNVSDAVECFGLK